MIKCRPERLRGKREIHLTVKQLSVPSPMDPLTSVWSLSCPGQLPALSFSWLQAWAGGGGREGPAGKMPLLRPALTSVVPVDMGPARGGGVIPKVQGEACAPLAGLRSPRSRWRSVLGRGSSWLGWGVLTDRGWRFPVRPEQICL